MRAPVCALVGPHQSGKTTLAHQLASDWDGSTAIFGGLRPLADRSGTPVQFLVLGSAAPDVIRGVSENSRSLTVGDLHLVLRGEERGRSGVIDELRFVLGQDCAERLAFW